MTRWRRFLTVMGTVFLWAPQSLAADAGQDAVVAGERYSLTAAVQGGRQLAWRVDRTDGRISVCVRTGQTSVICSPWSDPAGEKNGAYAINAEFSQAAGVAWVWRINTKSAQVVLCQVTTDRKLEAKPRCLSPN